MLKRKIIEIDAEKCDGCGLCVSACHEGAIAMVDGKARLVSDVYCDGLGDCLGECPQGAITMVEREAAPFDAAAVAARLGSQAAVSGGCPGSRAQSLGPAPAAVHGGCPGSRVQSFATVPAAARFGGPAPCCPSQEVKGVAPVVAGAVAQGVRNWPLQLHLVPVQAPYYAGARLLVAADCVAFACPTFHSTLLAERTVVIACPKLDDTSAYVEKLAAILRFNEVEAVEVAIMEVPCCGGLQRLVREAVARSGKALEVVVQRVSLRGEVSVIG